jgi:hypothetical protein
MPRTTVYEDIRHRTMQIRTEADILRRLVAAPYFNGRLVRVLADLDEIETLILPNAERAVDSHKRGVWLETAHRHLQVAWTEVFGIRSVVEIYGPDALIV